MSRAAIPEYLSQALSGGRRLQATPSQRFGPLLAIWADRGAQERSVNEMAGKKSPEAREIGRILTQQGRDAAIEHGLAERGNGISALWKKNESGSVDVLEKITQLGDDDRKRMKAWRARQAALADAVGAIAFEASASAPFSTGLGNAHPLENGFAFLEPYGLPYLPGSGVKGVLRAAALELSEGLFGDSRGWTLQAIKALFGNKPDDDRHELQRGALCFWDVLPGLNRLQIELMTPHQGHYYAAGKKPQPPHDSGKPGPILFLAVPPGASFTFHVQCNLPFLARTAPELAEGERWKALLEAAFLHAFQWLGFGAKTAVGYGAMHYDQEKAQERLDAARRAELSEAGRLIEDFVEHCKRRIEEMRGGKEDLYKSSAYAKARELAKLAEGEDWQPQERILAADQIEAWLPQVATKIDLKEVRKKLGLRKLRGESAG